MKTSDLIRKLQILLDKNGDRELRFTVQDNFSIHGESMHLILRVGDEGTSSDWFGSWTNEHTTTLNFYLDEKGGRRPNITFRKK